MARVTGRRVALTPARRAIVEVMRLSAGVPLVTIERTMNLRGLVEARAGLAAAPSWAAIFAKAYARVAARHPELRRAYLSWPWPHLYQADQSVASVAVEREYAGASCVFFAFVSNPDQHTLASLQAVLTAAKREPVEGLRHARRLLRYARLPWPLRSWAFRWGYHRSGHSRAKNFGTFGLTVTAGLGATLEHLVSPLTTTLTYGPVAADGTASVRLVFDHRVLDGAPAARALRDLEAVLTGELVTEVGAYRGPSPA